MEEEECKCEESSKRSMKEERRLWKALEESDKEQAKEEERRLKKEKKIIEQARLRMKVGKNQPSMKDILGKPKAKNDTGDESRVTTRIGAHHLDEVRFSTRKTKMTHQPDGNKMVSSVSSGLTKERMMCWMLERGWKRGTLINCTC